MVSCGIYHICFFLSYNSIIFDSIQSSTQNLIILAGRYCPILWTLSSLCYFTLGFHQGSKMKTYDALHKFNATQPVFKLNKNTSQRILFMKYLIIWPLSDIPPQSLTIGKEALFECHSSKFNILVNWENKIELIVFTLEHDLYNSSTNSSILVDDFQDLSEFNLLTILCFLNASISTSKDGYVRSILKPMWQIGQLKRSLLISMNDSMYSLIHNLQNFWWKFYSVGSSASLSHNWQIITPLCSSGFRYLFKT